MWVVVDKDGWARICENKPCRLNGFDSWTNDGPFHMIEPAVARILFPHMSWKSEPKQFSVALHNNNHPRVEYR